MANFRISITRFLLLVPHLVSFKFLLGVLMLWPVSKGSLFLMVKVKEKEMKPWYVVRVLFLAFHIVFFPLFVHLTTVIHIFWITAKSYRYFLQWIWGPCALIFLIWKVLYWSWEFSLLKTSQVYISMLLEQRPHSLLSAVNCISLITSLPCIRINTVYILK